MKTSPLHPSPARPLAPRPPRFVHCVLLVLAFAGTVAHAAIGFRAAASANSGSGIVTSLAINKPAGVVSGDFMLAQVSASPGVTITAPSGWTLVRSFTAGFPRTGVYRKLAGSSEPGSYTWTFSASARAAGGIVAFTGVNATTPIQVENGGVDSSSTTAHTTPTIATSGSETWLVALFGDRVSGSVGSTWTSTGTERVDTSASGTGCTSVAIYTQGPVAAGSYSRTGTATVSGVATMEIIALNPGAPAAPSGLGTTAVSSSQINLSWTDNAGNETGFEIDRATNAAFTADLVTVATGSVAGTGGTGTHSSTGLLGSTTYYFRVRATNASGDSANSGSANATTQIADLPFLGRYYGAGEPAATVGNSRMRASDEQGESFFFYAERTGTPTKFRLQIRSGTGYSDGNLGTYEVEIRGANATTRLPLTGVTAICKKTGYAPNNNVWFDGQEFEEITFTTTGQITAGQPYCLIFRNTHSDPTNNYFSVNHALRAAWDNDDTGGSAYTVPGSGGAMGGILVDSGGVDPESVGSTATRVAGWTPVKINGTVWHPYPIGTEHNGANVGGFRYRRHGPPLIELVYSNNVVTNWGAWGSGTTYVAAVSGTNEFRERFRVTRASRKVGGVYITGWANGTTGSLKVRLESGPENDDHTPASSQSTLIEEVTVPASLFLNAGTAWDYSQEGDGETGPLELPHAVWVPFSQNRTLNLGSTYNIRLVADACDVRIQCMGRADGPSAGFGVSGRSTATWALWASTRSVSWNAWEDSRGCQVSSDGGATWAYGPAAARFSPLLLKGKP